MESLISIIVLVFTCLVVKSTGEVDFIQNLANAIEVLHSGSQTQFGQALHVVNSYNDESVVQNPTVNTTSGLVIGSTLSEAHGFFSVPYAAPPVGNLRFRDTAEIQRSSQPINASVPNYVACRQRPRDECWAGYCMINQNEDCLVLNVHVPRHVDLLNPTAHRLPVLLWIHGGSFSGGSGTTPKYDGRHLSNATECIVISINYRVGAYGFLVYNKGNDHLNGNQGLKDQQMAMRWVQENIENFGGDKDRVTIFGESAGAQSVMWHMLSSVSRPLFRRAILESNAAIFPHQTPDEAMVVTNRLLTYTGCKNATDEFKCLLEADQAKLDQYPVIMAMSVLAGDGWSGVEPFRPIIDGIEFTDQPLTLFQAGKWNTDKEYIIGANTQEVEVLQYYIPIGGQLSENLYYKTNEIFLGEVGPIVAEYYTNLIGPDGNDYSKILGIEAGDAFFICPSRAMTRFAFDTADNPNNLYFYMFDTAPDGEYCHAVYPKNETCGYAYHSSEIPYVLRTGPDFGYIFNEDEIIVCDQFSKYWGNFARNGNPNDNTGGPDFPDFTNWPPYVRSNDGNSWSNIHLMPISFVETRYKEEICDFWDSLDFYVNMSDAVTPTTPDLPVKETTTVDKAVTTTGNQETTSSAKALQLSNCIPLLMFSSLRFSMRLLY